MFAGQSLTKQQLVAAGDVFGGAMRERSAVALDPEAFGISVLSNRGTMAATSSPTTSRRCPASPNGIPTRAT